MAQAILIAGLGWGDEGKGATTDFLCRAHNAHTVVRYNGGAQAGHNVVTSDGRHHTFAMFGAGTFAGARTHLSRHTIVNPIFFLSEGKALITKGVPDAFDRVTVEMGALITNPFQVCANRIREMARSNRHGSCGMGIGETMADWLDARTNADTRVITAADLRNLPRGSLRWKLEASQMLKTMQLKSLHSAECKPENGCSCPFAKEWEVLTDPGTIDLAMEYYAEFVDRVKIVPAGYLLKVMREGTTIFEGAQGVLLDQDLGFHPYTTWTDITFRNAFDLLGVNDEGPTVTQPSNGALNVSTGLFKGEVCRIGILRANGHTRHGAGPFPSEDATLDHPEPHNANGPWQQGFRRGHFDLYMARYALEAIGGVDELALTHLDRIQAEQKVCVGYGDAEGPLTMPCARFMWEIRENLKDREMITQSFMKWHPRYDHFRHSPEGFATEIGSLLGVRIGSMAFGPRAEDRRTV